MPRRSWEHPWTDFPFQMGTVQRRTNSCERLWPWVVFRQLSCAKRMCDSSTAARASECAIAANWSAASGVQRVLNAARFCKPRPCIRQLRAASSEPQLLCTLRAFHFFLLKGDSQGRSLSFHQLRTAEREAVRTGWTGGRTRALGRMWWRLTQQSETWNTEAHRPVRYEWN